MVSQFGSLGYTIMGKTADLTIVQKTIIQPQTFIAKEAGCSQSAVSSMLTESWVEGKSVEKKMHNQPREPQPYEDCQAKSIQEFGWTSQGMDWGWGQGIKTRATSHRRVEEFGYSCRQRCLTWAKEKKNWTVAQWSKVLFSDESRYRATGGSWSNTTAVVKIFHRYSPSSVAKLKGLRDSSELKKLNASNNWDSLNENPVQRIQSLRLGRSFTFKQDYDPKNSKSGL